MRLKGKKAIVTGGSKGIGRAICIDLAKEGADVLINYFNSEEEANRTLNLVRDYSKDSYIYRTDTSDEIQVKKMILNSIEIFGRVDILVNNAAIDIKSPFLEYKNEDWERVMGVNLNGYRFCSKYVAQNMIKNKSGKIINISSVHDVMCYKNEMPYELSKAAIKMFTKVLALELSEYGIYVNSVSPGAIKTDMNKEVLKDKKYLKKILDRIPLNRIGKPEEVAKVVTFLCTDDASYINGITIYVDGGILLNYAN